MRNGSHTSNIAQIEGSESCLRVAKAGDSEGVVTQLVISITEAKTTRKEHANSENQIERRAQNRMKIHLVLLVWMNLVAHSIYIREEKQLALKVKRA